MDTTQPRTARTTGTGRRTARTTGAGRPTARRVPAAALAVVLAGGLLAGCAGRPGTPAPTPTSAAPPSSAAPTPPATPEPTATPAPEPTDGLAPFTAPGTEASAEGDAGGYVVAAVRTGTHDGYDRVVYELTGGTGTPGYRVGYVEQAVEDPSGEVRDVDGDAVLRVWLAGTTYPVEGGAAEFAEDLRPAAGTVVHVVRPLTFEGMTQSFVGVAGQARPFRVQVLADPVRVVVDVEAG